MGELICPAHPAAGSRSWVQVTTADGQFVRLTITEWADLCCAVRLLAGEFPSPHPVALPR